MVDFARVVRVLASIVMRVRVRLGRPSAAPALMVNGRVRMRRSGQVDPGRGWLRA